jgi:H+/Cl- antiporter ClcA
VKLAAIKDEIYLDALMAAGIIGVAGGMIGSLFIRINNFVNVIRKKVLGASKPRKVIEACVLVVLTVTVVYSCSYFRNQDAVCKI